MEALEKNQNVHNSLNVLWLEQLKEQVDAWLGDDVTGHDKYHAHRVGMMGIYLYLNEACALDRDVFESLSEKQRLQTLYIMGYIHDCFDHKLFSNQDIRRNIQMLHHILSQHYDRSMEKQLFTDCYFLSYSKNKAQTHILSALGKCVQDADRLDALGAIGIARCFAYGAYSHQKIYSEDDEKTSLHHFEDKLYHLPQLMNTSTAFELATQRVNDMKQFEQEFLKEWFISF